MWGPRHTSDKPEAAFSAWLCKPSGTRPSRCTRPQPQWRLWSFSLSRPSRRRSVSKTRQGHDELCPKSVLRSNYGLSLLSCFILTGKDVSIMVEKYSLLSKNSQVLFHHNSKWFDFSPPAVSHPLHPVHCIMGEQVSIFAYCTGRAYNIIVLFF